MLIRILIYRGNGYTLSLLDLLRIEHQQLRLLQGQSGLLPGQDGCRFTVDLPDIPDKNQEYQQETHAEDPDR